MGDHRASIKIEMDFHDKIEKADMWINYSPGPEGVDERVMNFFRKAYRDGMNRWEEKEFEYQVKKYAERIKEEESITRNELAELNRLKEKYEIKSEDNE